MRFSVQINILYFSIKMFYFRQNIFNRSLFSVYFLVTYSFVSLCLIIKQTRSLIPQLVFKTIIYFQFKDNKHLKSHISFENTYLLYWLALSQVRFIYESFFCKIININKLRFTYILYILRKFKDTSVNNLQHFIMGFG